MKILVSTAFNLLFDGRMQPYSVGVHDVQPDVASHWYTQMHAEIIDGQPAAELDATAQAEPEAAVEVQAQEPAAEAVVDASEPDQFEAMTDENLRAFIKDRDGRSPHPKTSREKLLKSARGDAATSSEIEAEPEAAA